MHVSVRACECVGVRAYACVWCVACAVLYVCIHTMYLFVSLHVRLQDVSIYVHLRMLVMCLLLQLHEGSGKLFDVGSRKCQAKLEGHEGDVSKVMLLVMRYLILKCEFVCRLHLILKAQGSLQQVVTKQLGYGK